MNDLDQVAELEATYADTAHSCLAETFGHDELPGVGRSWLAHDRGTVIGLRVTCLAGAQFEVEEVVTCARALPRNCIQGANAWHTMLRCWASATF